jgi:hypothetical protein
MDFLYCLPQLAKLGFYSDVALVLYPDLVYLMDTDEIDF